MSVGANIRRIREERGLTQAYLAEKAGISQAMLCQIERETKNPSLQVSVEIAALLDCDVKDLCDSRVRSVERAKEKPPGRAAGRGSRIIRVKVRFPFPSAL